MNRRQKSKPCGVVLPLLEDANSIQLAIQMVAQAAADRRITRGEAGMLLYSVQLAIMNLKNVRVPEAVYSVQMFALPTRGDEHEDLAPEIVIPKDEDQEFEEDEGEDDDVEESEEEIEAAEKFVSENLGRLKELGVRTG